MALKPGLVFFATVGANRWVGEPKRMAGAFCLLLEEAGTMIRRQGIAYVREAAELSGHAMNAAYDIKAANDADFDSLGPSGALTFAVRNAGFKKKLDGDVLAAIQRDGVAAARKAFSGYKECWHKAGLHYHTTGSIVREAHGADELEIIEDLQRKARKLADEADKRRNWPPGLAEEAECS